MTFDRPDKQGNNRTEKPRQLKTKSKYTNPGYTFSKTTLNYSSYSGNGSAL